MNKITLIFMYIIAVLIHGTAFADVIYLRSGEVYVGKILKENDIYVRFDALNAEDGRMKEFLPNEIQSIERGTMMINPDLRKKESPREEIKTVPQIKSSPALIEEEKRTADLTGPAVTLTNEDINQMLSDRPESSMPEDIITSEAIEINMGEKQIIQMQNQLAEMQSPQNIGKMILMVVGMLIGMSIIPLIICGVIGFFLARRFDSSDGDTEKIETIPPAASLNRQVPIQQATPSIKPLGSTFPTGMSSDASAKGLRKGGLIRRLIARNIDLYLGVGPIGFILTSIGIFMPMDQISSTMLLLFLLPLMFSFFYYFFFSIHRKNTYGRYLMGIQVVDVSTGKKVTLGQAFKRDLFLFLWPVDFFILIFSKAKRRIGDRFAGTKVVVVPSKTKWPKRLAPGFLAGVVIYASLYLSAPYVNDRTVIAGVAKEYLRQKYDASQLTKPQRIEILNHEGVVYMKLVNGMCYAVSLERSGKSWSVKASTRIPENMVGRGFSLRYE